MRWGLALIVLDNDVHLDAAATGAPPPAGGDPQHANAYSSQPRGLWQGQSDSRPDQATWLKQPRRRPAS